jgi:hypothetical protein
MPAIQLVVATLVQLQCAQHPLEDGRALRYGQMAFRSEDDSAPGFDVAHFKLVEDTKGETKGVAHEACARLRRSMNEKRALRLELAREGELWRLVGLDFADETGGSAPLRIRSESL